LALEALDEMGISPVAIAGTFMGTTIGGAYAAGIKGRAIRNHLLRVISNRPDVMSKLLQARVGRFADLVLRGRGNPVQSWRRSLRQVSGFAQDGPAGFRLPNSPAGFR
jgi:predicted acylesterase/phospholipase RssA